jgi:hypothetical protein
MNYTETIIKYYNILFFLCPVVRIESDHMRHVSTSFSAPLRAGSPCDLDTGSHAI